MSRSLAPSRSPLVNPLHLASALAFAVTGFVTPASGAIHDVVQEGQSFEPALVVIQPGDTVRWTWTIGIHTVTSGSNCDADGLFDAPLDTGHRTFSFTFPTAGTYDYFCVPHCAMGMTGTVEVENTANVPETSETSIGAAAFPNPFSSFTDLSFALPEAGALTVEIFDASGRLTRVFHDGAASAGPRRVQWDGLDANGEAAPSGIYYVRIVASGQSEVVRLVKVE
jgi:plastocyanin